MTRLEPLPPVRVEAVELLTLRLPLATPLRSAAGDRTARTVLLVHVLAEGVEGWAECAAEDAPTYSPEYVDAALLTLRDHLLPRAWAAGIGDVFEVHAALAAVRGHAMAKAALELAVLDAQLRAADRSLATWLGVTEPAVPPGASLGLHDDVDLLLAEADDALHAGATRLRVKITPGCAFEPLKALRSHVGPDVPLQADANGSFRADDTELSRLDAVGLTCLEQPLPSDDLVGHARLAAQLETPICLDESITSLAALEAAVALGACQVLCLKPARVGGWIAAHEIHRRGLELGLPMWVGGMLDTAVGRAANVAVAALPGMTLAPDLDPRGRFDPDLADPLLPGPDGLVAVPEGPGIGVVPAGDRLAGATVVRSLAP